ncbi:hypothetical protein EEB11_17800 [Pseudotabrizicola sediminis]|uniref:AIPR protein n=1 Tax=Pseudotabrizicola sediminis TaxID=2486418 RepID=A0ABY2KH49_9RHOB|nr:AIPR family protein [Pseudotabrizicola sediminis]TGD41608.1 hypothetical protein EEB11_17800 [Pseudotabrizicola sediminis]
MNSVEDFNSELLAGLRAEHSETDIPLVDLAFDRFCGTLESEGEIEAVERVAFVGTSSGKTLRIDGTGGDPRDADGVLSVIIFEMFDQDAPPTINAADAKRLFSHVMNFVAASLRRTFRDGLHPEMPAAGTAQMIASAWKSVTKVKLILVTNAIYSARIDAVLAGAIAEIPVTYNIWDLTRFHRIETSGAREKIVVRFDRDFGGALPALIASGDDTAFPSYLAVIRGRQLAELYERWGARLLESNIRSFIQARRRSVNDGIRTTIRDEPEMFFSYNNGLSATADQVEIDGSDGTIRILAAHNLQIVNGGQTTASLHAALRQSPGNLDRVHVQVKLTVVPPDVSEDVVPNISKFANSQNKIDAADFFSNHPFHLRVEEFSRRLFAPPAQGTNRQTLWFYERAKGQYLVERARAVGADRTKFDRECPKAQLFLKTDLAKVEYSFRMKPDTVSKGAQKNFAAFATDIGETWSDEEAGFDEVWFRRAVARIIVFRALEKAVPRQDWYPGGYRANIITYGIAKLVHDSGRTGRAINLDDVWAAQSVPEALMRDLLSACEAAADVLTSPAAGLKNVTEWAKKPTCWDAVLQCAVSYPDEDAAPRIRIVARARAH